jgi:hypothetical protein
VDKANEYAKTTNEKTKNGKDKGSRAGVVEEQVDMR